MTYVFQLPDGTVHSRHESEAEALAALPPVARTELFGPGVHSVYNGHRFVGLIRPEVPR